MAGVESGEYNTTRFAKQGDLGIHLPVTPTGTVWKAGGLGQTGWYIVSARDAIGWWMGVTCRNCVASVSS